MAYCRWCDRGFPLVPGDLAHHFIGSNIRRIACKNAEAPLVATISDFMMPDDVSFAPVLADKGAKPKKKAAKITRKVKR